MTRCLRCTTRYAVRTAREAGARTARALCMGPGSELLCASGTYSTDARGVRVSIQRAREQARPSGSVGSAGARSRAERAWRRQQARPPPGRRSSRSPCGTSAAAARTRKYDCQQSANLPDASFDSRKHSSNRSPGRTPPQSAAVIGHGRNGLVFHPSRRTCMEVQGVSYRLKSTASLTGVARLGGTDTLKM